MTTFEPKTTLRMGRLLYPGARSCYEPCAEPSLATVVRAAVATVNECTLTSACREDSQSVFGPKSLLAVLSFCYACQVYGSAEIENVLMRNYSSCHIRQDQVPKAATIARFRSQNRHAIRTCLLAALRFLADQKMAQGLVSRVNRAHLEAEATRRITTAAFIDAMAAEHN